jgi:hypothetical protein
VKVLGHEPILRAPVEPLEVQLLAPSEPLLQLLNLLINVYYLSIILRLGWWKLRFFDRLRLYIEKEPVEIFGYGLLFIIFEDQLGLIEEFHKVYKHVYLGSQFHKVSCREADVTKVEGDYFF